MSFYTPTTEQIRKLSCQWCCSFSGGKDSTTLVTWLEWLRRTGQIDAPTPQLVQSDTTVEDPALSAVSSEMRSLLERCGWKCAMVKPRINEKLYNRILGIGNTPIHPGISNMRWCSRSTKIDPMSRWRKENASGLVLTGVRIGESSIRDRKLLKSSCSAGGECGLPNPSDDIYGPIINWRTCEVVDWLNGLVSFKLRSGLSDVFSLTRKLVGIYGMRTGQPSFETFGEPEIVAARFGCTGCPAISSTREAPKSSVRRYGADSPLNELYDVWFEARQRKNRCVRVKDGKDGYGPIRMEARKRLFARVLDIQKRSGVTLVDVDDVAFIQDCWRHNVYPRGWSAADEATKPAKDMFEQELSHAKT